MASRSEEMEKKTTEEKGQRAMPSSSIEVKSVTASSSTGVRKKITEDKRQRAMPSTSMEVDKKTTENDPLTSLLEVIKKRTKMPEKLKRVESRILHRQRKQAKDVTMLFSSDTKKMACGYNLRKPLPKEFEENKEEHDPDKMLARMEKIIEKQPGIQKAKSEMVMGNKFRKSMDIN